MAAMEAEAHVMEAGHMEEEVQDGPQLVTMLQVGPVDAWQLPRIS